MKKLVASFALVCAALLSVSANAGMPCTGKFPNLVNDVCWSCTFPIKMFNSMTLYGGDQDDWDSGDGSPVCFCKNPPQMGVPVAFWELDQMFDVPTAPGCFPILNGLSVNTGVNKGAYGQISDDNDAGVRSSRQSFRHVNFYINPAMYLMGAILDSNCIDNRGFDVPWASFLDPTHTDEEMANILTPYAFPFGSMLAIGAMSFDAISATAGFPRSEIFWAAGAQGHMYPLTGNNEAHISNEQSARLQGTRVLAKLHAAGTQWSTYGSGGMCSGYPQIIMDKRQYKFTRLLPIPQTLKIAGKCCDPIGRSTILVESGTEAPLPSMKDFGYAIFRKRDCCQGALP